MAAETRWVEYGVASATSDYLGLTTSGVGTRGRVKANNTISDALDRFTIGPTNNILTITMDGGTPDDITLTSGVNLDARFVTKDITEKMHAENPTNNSWAHATCEWVNNQIHIYSGNVGAAASAALSSGTNTALTTLGFASNTQDPGTPHSWKAQNGYNGGITVSGTGEWEGIFDEAYTIIINKVVTIGSPTGNGGGFTGTITHGGQYNHGSGDSTYTITIDTADGATVGGGAGGVPKFSWTSDGTPDNGGPVEILYSDHWYNVGTRGLKVKWSDDVFIHNGTWSIACTKPLKAEGDNATAAPGAALYVWTSTRGDECTSPLTTSDTTFTRVGKRGLYMKFIGGSNNLSAGDEFRVVCTPPQPSTYNILSLNYGNVTVTTESPVKCVLFEIMGGAVMMTSVKFGLQNHGSFNYHNPGDTYFRWGTIGGENTAGGSPTENKEWHTNVTADDLSGTLPAYLHANEDNLPVVATADGSKPIGNYQGGLVSDFVYLCIALGADETGSNSSINYRLYFDYS
jgi:hypothetical protein